jgi:hypothetical protein
MERRPYKRDDDVVRSAVKRLVPRIITWMEDEVESEEALCEEIVEAYQRHIHDDGFAVAKYLDDTWWGGGNSELVEILDGGFSYIRTAHKEATAEWIKRNNIQPRYSVGDAVTVKHTGEPLPGIIRSVDDQWGTYTVYVEALGHKKEGEGCGTLGIVLEWEKVEGA